MITNIPTYEDLNDTSLRLYFSVWKSLINIINDFDMMFEPNPNNKDEWEDEYIRYMIECQHEFRYLCATIAQSMEISLKAKICKVSPYLLIINSDIKLKRESGNIDFSTLRTIDAVDLPNAVASICDYELSEKYIQAFHKIRSLRNKILHLGGADDIFSIDKIVGYMITHYRETWPNGQWLADRLRYASATRGAFFHDGRYSSPHADVLEELPQTFKMIKKSNFKLLFNIEKTKRRYFCESCMEEARLKWSDFKHDEFKTAVLIGDDTCLRCLMCDTTFPVERTSCSDATCKGNVISAKTGYCHTCGEHVSEQ